MCGIAGIISEAALTENQLRPVLSSLLHRGPDDEGMWLGPGGQAGLAHRRLSIIDLDSRSAQPMTFAGRYHIVHNGELYNYLELRETLKAKGVSFFTASDTEVIVAAYAEWGKDCLLRFDGMFAFAIWDEREQKLFAARDRFGEKPLFFHLAEDRFVFASTLKALWQLKVPREVNPFLLYNFLSIGYTSNPGDPGETFFRDVTRLAAGSFLEYDRRSRTLSLEKYDHAHVQTDPDISREDAVVRFRELLTDSVRKRLRSDVSVGTSLSGGLDSAAIVALADKVKTERYSHTCFTAHFEGYEKDELRFAKIIAHHYGLQHHVVTVDESTIPALMEKVMDQQEEPFGSGSVLAQYRVYEEARRKGITVLLDGQGADEVLAGYHRYYPWFWQELYRKKKLSASGEREAAEKMGIRASFSLSNKLAALWPQLAAAVLEGRREKEAFRHPDLNREFAFSCKRHLYYTLPARFDLNGALFFNTYVNGLEELLRLADRNSMAHGTEVRLPYLQHELVNFLFTLPAEFKIHQGWTKWLLRESVAAELPSDITWRRDKVGFEPPQEAWMRRKDVQEAIRSGKQKLVDQNILDPVVLKKAKPHSAYAAHAHEWRYWSASYLFP